MCDTELFFFGAKWQGFELGHFLKDAVDSALCLCSSCVENFVSKQFGNYGKSVSISICSVCVGGGIGGSSKSYLLPSFIVSLFSLQ